MKRIVFSYHANLRLTQKRQEGVTHEDVYAACHLAKEILQAGVPEPLRLRDFISKEGIKFNISVVDCAEGLKIITVIGYKYYRRAHTAEFSGLSFSHMPYKKRMKMLKSQKKRERKYIETTKSERYVRTTGKDREHHS